MVNNYEMSCQCGYREETFIQIINYFGLGHSDGINLRSYLLKKTGTLVYKNYLQILETSNSTKDTITIIKLTLIFIKTIGKSTINLSF